MLRRELSGGEDSSLLTIDKTDSNPLLWHMLLRGPPGFMSKSEIVHGHK